MNTLPELPRSDSAQAQQAIEAMFAERNYPSSPNACARLGFEAAVRLIKRLHAEPSAEARSEDEPALTVPYLTNDTPARTFLLVQGSKTDVVAEAGQRLWAALMLHQQLSLTRVHHVPIFASDCPVAETRAHLRELKFDDHPDIKERPVVLLVDGHIRTVVAEPNTPLWEAITQRKFKNAVDRELSSTSPAS